MKIKSVIVRNLIWSLVGLAVMLLISLWGYIAIPDGKMIATHWGANGQPDGYSSKATALFLTPIILFIVVVGLFSVIAYIEPRKEHLQASLKVFSYGWFSVFGIFVVLHAFTVLNALGYKLDITTAVGCASGIAFMIVGNVLGKVRSNWFMGARTPWTLSSEYVWNKTNRTGGKLLFGLGIIIAIVSLLGNPILLFSIITFIGIFMAVLIVIYSFVVWKNEQTNNKPGLFENYILPIAFTFVILAGFVIYSTTRPVQSEIFKQNREAAVQITNSLVRGDYKAIRPRFNQVMKDSLPNQQLKATWDDVIKGFGEFQSIKKTREEKYFSYQIIYCTVKFTKGKINVELIFDADGKVTGLWFKP